MKWPKRGEIWGVTLSDPSTGREARGTEMGAKVNERTRAAEPDRCCLVVSSNIFNANRMRITVAPLTSYEEGKDLVFPKTAVTVKNIRDISLDPRNRTYHELFLSEEKEYRSIIDCAQLWTIFAFTRSSPNDHPGLPCDLRWDRRNGSLNDMLEVESSLQILLNGVLRKRSEIPGFDEGDVLTLDLPGNSAQRCLIVSSPAIDARREQVRVHAYKKPLGHVTVVPLVEDPPAYLAEDCVQVTLISKNPPQNREELYAICSEIYTVDWRARGRGRPVAWVPDLSEVRVALRNYLNLPE